jgi:alpha-mannosidase
MASLGGLERFFVVPHTHWDREWYWSFERFRLELARVVDGVLDVLEADPAFVSFTLDGQAVILEDYLELRPGNEQRLRALLAAGRLETGPVYVQQDEFLVGGEALVRNLLVGRAVCERFGAAPTSVAYLPDGFGHPAQLPQILAGFGIEALLFSRGMGDELDEVGVLFEWQARNGSSVRAFPLLPDYSNFGWAQAGEGDDDGAAPATVQRVRDLAERFGGALARVGVGEFLLCNGSDHLPVQPEMPRLCTELERAFPGVRFALGGYRDYVRAVRPSMPLASLRGELLGGRLQNVLRGVNSARLYLKQANEAAERRLLTTETLWALRALHDGTPYPTADFALAWRDLLRCQPHDSICGCSCDEVHRDMLVRYGWLDRTLDALGGRALGAVQAGSVGVFNPLPFARRVLVERDGWEPAVVEVEGFAAQTVELVERSEGAVASPQGGSAVAIESDLLRVEAAPDGTLTLVDLERGSRHEGLHALEDESDMGDLYTFCPLPGAQPWRSGEGHASARVLAEGPVVWELELSVRAERPEGLDGELRGPLASTVPLTVTTIVRLVRGSRRVEFRTAVENAARDHRVRAAFAVGGHGDVVRAEGHFAVARRPLVPPAPATAWVEPPALTGHTLGAVALGELVLLTKGLPEYEARPGADGDELLLTLLRATGLISRREGELATRPRCAGPDLATPEGQCLGRYELEYALLVGAGDLDDAALLRASQDYRFGATLLVPGFDRPAPVELVELEGDVVFSSLAGAYDGDGFVLRCFNPCRRVARARVIGPVEAVRTRLDETGGEALEDGTVSVASGEIATLRLRRA